MEGVERGYLTGTSRFKYLQGEGIFLTASIDPGELSLRVISNRFAMAAQCRRLFRKRPPRCVALSDATAMSVALALIAISVAGILGLGGLGSLPSSVLPCREPPGVRPSK